MLADFKVVNIRVVIAMPFDAGTIRQHGTLLPCSLILIPQGADSASRAMIKSHGVLLRA
jgi:hypothetical protein